MRTVVSIGPIKIGRKWRPFKRGARVGMYQILHVAGQDDLRALYLATRRDSNDLYWLLQSSTAGAPAVPTFAGSLFSEEAGTNCVVFPVEGSSLATLLQLVNALNWSFIAPRWVAMLDETGSLHVRGQLFQQGRPLDLASILFGHEAQLLPLPYHPASSTVAFRAPEISSSAPTPASDVYTLGAALLFVLGGESPEIAFLNKNQTRGQLAAKPGLARVLRRATDPDPAKRFPDADAFARALGAIVPREQLRQALGRVPKIAPSNLLLFAFLLIAVLLALVFWVNRPFFVSLALAHTPTQIVQPAAQPGALTLEVTNLEFTPDQTGHIELNLSREGTPVPYGLPVQFSVSINGQTIQPVTVEKNPAGSGDESGRYRLSFASPALPLTGNYLVTARLIGNTLARSIYYEAPPVGSAVNTPDVSGTPEKSNGLAGLSIVGFQVDTDHYPELALYFTLSGQDGKPGRVRGPLTVQVDQDRQLASEFTMIPNDRNDNPVTTALALDISGSMQGQPIAGAQQAANDFVNATGAGDAVCIYTFSTVLSRLQDCTTDNQASTMTLKGMAGSGNTALFELIGTISDDLSKLGGRKAILLFSDGADTASRVNKETALAHLRRTNIPIYAIGLSSYQFQPQIMRELASASGGVYLEVPSAANLKQLYALIDAQLKNQYRITMKSASPSKNSGNLTIRLMKDAEKIEATRSFVVGK